MLICVYDTANEAEILEVENNTDRNGGISTNHLQGMSGGKESFVTECKI